MQDVEDPDNEFVLSDNDSDEEEDDHDDRNTVY